jgi:hypothetical protein
LWSYYCISSFLVQFILVCQTLWLKYQQLWMHFNVDCTVVENLIYYTAVMLFAVRVRYVLRGNRPKSC